MARKPAERGESKSSDAAGQRLDPEQAPDGVGEGGAPRQVSARRHSGPTENTRPGEHTGPVAIARARKGDGRSLILYSGPPGRA